jgi:hypothetical protein
MMNDEGRMTNQETMTHDQAKEPRAVRPATSSFVIADSQIIHHSGFVIRYVPQAQTNSCN